VTVDNSPTSAEGSGSAGTGRAPARRKPAGKRPAKAAARPPARRKPAARRRPKAPASSWKNVVDTITSRASAAGASMASASGDGVARARQALEEAGEASRRAIDSLAAQWKRLDPKKRAAVFAALIAALAAASAPVVGSRMKKK
jgi:hypothetical protein